MKNDKKTIRLNFDIPLELSLKIDKHLISIRQVGVTKSKIELLTDLIQIGLSEAKEVTI